MSKRTKIARAIILFKAGQNKTGPRVRRINLREQKALIVTKADIVSRPILLDQLPLQQQCLLLISNKVHLKIPYRVKESPGLVICTLLPRGHEMVSQSLPEVTGFSHVDH